MHAWRFPVILVLANVNLGGPAMALEDWDECICSQLFGKDAQSYQPIHPFHLDVDK
jgi:hypothetical protein